MATDPTSDIGKKIEELNKTIEELINNLKRSNRGNRSGGNGGGFWDGGGYSPNDNWKHFYEPLRQTKRWSEMSDEERKEFKQEGKRRKREAKDAARREIKKEKTRRAQEDLIDKSGLGNTRFGRSMYSNINRQRRADSMASASRFLRNGGAQKLGNSMFANSKAAGMATKGLMGFGKGLGFASKLLKHPFVNAIMTVIDIIRFVGGQVGDWKKMTAEMYKHQTDQERLQYELTKQQYAIRQQMDIENISAIGDKQLRMLDAQSAIMLEGLTLSIGQYVKGIETTLGPMMKGINQSAYDAASYSIDAAADYEKLTLHKDQREQQYQRYEDLRNLQQQGKIANLEAEQNVAETQYKIDSQKRAQEFTHLMESEYTGKNMIRNANENLLNYNEQKGVTEDNTIGGYNRFSKQNFKTTTSSEEAGVSTSITNPNALGAAVQKAIGFQQGQQEKEKAELAYNHEQMRESADYIKTVVDYQYQVATTQKDYANQIQDKMLDVQVQASEKVIESAAEVRKIWLKLAQTIEQYTINFEKSANNLAKNYGYTNKKQLQNFEKTMIRSAREAAKFGLAPEEWMQIQNTFIESTGRNRQFGLSDVRQLSALGDYLGDNNLAANYASEMEIFNAGVADSVDMLGEVLQDVNRIGLNGRKYTKTLVDNLKLAQKYTFKGGTKGLMEMAKWAENTRFNMSSLSGMLDKVSEGGLEGVITQGAQFQVLGGHAAMNADPIAMMYERYADPEAFAKRMQDMTIGYGSLNRETGETTFTGPEQMLMEQLAKVQGRSVEDVMNEVRARNKKEVVAKHLGSNFDDDQISYISNNATYNKKKGIFEIMVQKENGEYGTKAVNELTPDDLENLIPEKHNERMEQYMLDIISLEKQTKSEEEREKLLAVEGTFANTINAIGERVEKAMKTFDENYSKYVTEIKKGQDEATSQFSNYIEMAKRGNELIDGKASDIQAEADKIGIALADTAKIIEKANENMAKAEVVRKNEIGENKPTGYNKVKEQSEASYTGKGLHHVNEGEVVDITAPFTQRILTRGQKLGNEYNGGNPYTKKSWWSSKIKWTEEGAKAYNSFIDKENGVSTVSENKSVAKTKRTQIPSAYQNADSWSRDAGQNMGDGIISSNNNQPMISRADKVTKINDGLVKSDPKDVAIFAKEGGVIGNFIADLYNDIHSMKNDYRNVTIHMDGRLELMSENGQSVNLVSALQNDPNALREVARMLFEHEDGSNNGGRGVSHMARNYGRKII